ncbi:hypothetical protein BHE74_00032448 [Ensete ventricosum]|nr:hypothetical protein BHE74_00032448 [Ensete ventricosum]
MIGFHCHLEPFHQRLFHLFSRRGDEDEEDEEDDDGDEEGEEAGDGWEATFLTPSLLPCGPSVAPSLELAFESVSCSQEPQARTRVATARRRCFRSTPNASNPSPNNQPLLLRGIEEKAWPWGRTLRPNRTGSPPRSRDRHGRRIDRFPSPLAIGWGLDLGRRPRGAKDSIAAAAAMPYSTEQRN